MRSGLNRMLSVAAVLVFAQPVNAKTHSEQEGKARRNLELRVWTSTQQDLVDLENEVVRKIQEQPYDAFHYYLLSHLNLRMFTNSPQDLALVKRASEMAQQAVDLSPKEDYGFIALAETLDLMGQADRGISLLETAAASGVKPTWRYYFTLARLNAQKATQEKVLGLLEQSLAFIDSQPEIVVPYVVAVLQTSITDSDELLTSLFAWDAKFPNNLFKQTVAIELSDDRQYEKAHLIYKAIYKKNHHPEAKVNDAILLYKHLGRPKEAISLFRQVLDTHDLEQHDRELNLVVLSHLGAAYLTVSDIKNAEVNFIAAVKAASDRLAIIDFASSAYREQKQAKHLSEFITKLTTEITPSGVLFAILGETLSEDLERHEDALKSFSNAILLEPSRSDFYNGMGLAYYRMEQHENALKLFREATKIDPNDATAMYNGACVLSKLGRVSESLGALEEAIALDPRLATHARTDKDFSNIANHPDFDQLLGEAGHPSEDVDHVDNEQDIISH